MINLLIASLALAATPADAAPAKAPHVIGCHPGGKVIGCAMPTQVAAQHRANGTMPVTPELAKADLIGAPTKACHPDPSRNRGCFRPAIAPADAGAMTASATEPSRKIG